MNWVYPCPTRVHLCRQTMCIISLPLRLCVMSLGLRMRTFVSRREETMEWEMYTLEGIVKNMKWTLGAKRVIGRERYTCSKMKEQQLERETGFTTFII